MPSFSLHPVPDRQRFPFLPSRLLRPHIRSSTALNPPKLECLSRSFIVAVHKHPRRWCSHPVISLVDKAPLRTAHHELSPTQAVDVGVEVEEIDRAQPTIEGGFGTAENTGQ